MLSINKTIIKSIIKGVDSKKNRGKTNSSLYSLYAQSMFNYNDIISEESEYSMGSWIEHTDRWLHNRLNPNKTKYGRVTIAMIDLGATNFGSEPSYLHPAVIIAENTYFVLIVPASTQKYGKGYGDIIDATSADGFIHNTGVQSKSYRWVSKSRIESIVGKASSRLLDEIDTSMLKDIPSYKKEVAKYKAEIKKLTDENNELKDKISGHDNEIKSVKSELTDTTLADSI